MVTLEQARTLRPIYLHPSVHSSCCSATTAPTSRINEVRSGKIPTISVRRRILVQSFLRIVGPDLIPNLLRKYRECEQLSPCIIEVRCYLREFVRQCVEHSIILFLNTFRVRLIVYRMQHRLRPPPKTPSSGTPQAIAFSGGLTSGSPRSAFGTVATTHRAR